MQIIVDGATPKVQRMFAVIAIAGGMVNFMCIMYDFIVKQNKEKGNCYVIARSDNDEAIQKVACEDWIATLLRSSQ